MNKTTHPLIPSGEGKVSLLTNQKGKEMKIIFSVLCFSLMLMNQPIFSQENTDDFFKAIQMGEIEKVTKFLEEGMNVNLQTDFSATPLIFAIWGNHIDLIELLISKGADVKLKTKKMGTALGIAASMGNQKICELLLQNGAEINVPDNEGKTPLMLAVYNKKSNLVKFLLIKKPVLMLKNPVAGLP